jgi:hypothetical protein
MALNKKSGIDPKLIKKAYTAAKKKMGSGKMMDKMSMKKSSSSCKK